MIRIWGRKSAFNVQKVLWALDETTVRYERIDAGGPHGGLESAEYKARNPNGRIPTLDDDGVIVWESNAIIRYLAAKYGQEALWLSDPAQRAVADQWMDWMQTTLYRDFIDLFWSLVRTPENQRDWCRIRTANERIARHYAILDARLADHAYLAGERFSMADIPAGSTLYRYYAMDIDHPALPNLAHWYARLRSRPAFAANVMMPFDDLRGRTTF